MNIEFERAIIGVDGNCGFALLGEDLQIGECEFVEIDSIENADPYRYYSADWLKKANLATRVALANLKTRLGIIDLSYALDSSHPFSC